MSGLLDTSENFPLKRPISCHDSENSTRRTKKQKLDLSIQIPVLSQTSQEVPQIPVSATIRSPIRQENRNFLTQSQKQLPVKNSQFLIRTQWKIMQTDTQPQGQTQVKITQTETQIQPQIQIKSDTKQIQTIDTKQQQQPQQQQPQPQQPQPQQQQQPQTEIQTQQQTVKVVQNPQQTVQGTQTPQPHTYSHSLQVQTPQQTVQVVQNPQQTVQQIVQVIQTPQQTVQVVQTPQQTVQVVQNPQQTVHIQPHTYSHSLQVQIQAQVLSQNQHQLQIHQQTQIQPQAKIQVVTNNNSCSCQCHSLKSNGGQSPLQALNLSNNGNGIKSSQTSKSIYYLPFPVLPESPHGDKDEVDQWYWDKSGRGTDFQPYGSEANTQINEAFLEGKNGVVVTINSQKYEIHFIVMIQRNCNNGKRRMIVSRTSLETSPSWKCFFPEKAIGEPNFSVISVTPGESEFIEVEKFFGKTLPTHNIFSIDKIINHHLRAAWNFELEQVKERNNDPNIEYTKLLFHGTRNIHPSLIYNSDRGFKAQLGSAGMWGQGSYFAVKASYSDKYAFQVSQPELPIVKRLLLCEVIVGDSYYSLPNRDLKLPPPKKEKKSNFGFEVERYDSVCGITQASKVYIVYDSPRAYPTYVITYGNGTKYSNK